MDKALFSSVKMDWQTPESVLDLVRRVAPIVLDPCTSLENPTGAMSFFAYPENSLCGLTERWHSCQNGIVFVNPPYGRALGAWAAKIVAEAQAGCEIIALVPARTDTKWFHLMADHMTSLLLWKGRLTFKGAPAPAPFPSALFYFGKRWERFAEVFSPYGIDI